MSKLSTLLPLVPLGHVSSTEPVHVPCAYAKRGHCAVEVVVGEPEEPWHRDVTELRPICARADRPVCESVARLSEDPGCGRVILLRLSRLFATGVQPALSLDHIRAMIASEIAELTKAAPPARK